MKTYQFDVNVIFEMDDIIEVQAKNEDEAFEKATQAAAKYKNQKESSIGEGNIKKNQDFT